MADKRIIWSTHASNELKQILEYFNQRNKSTRYSLKLLNEIEELTKSLSKNELIGRLTSNKLTRVIPMKVYLIFYEVHQDHIQIVSFWDNRQDTNRRLEI
ncbi:type II toxin-antitoxin system RelE/ParE family toxin [Roseimarinus sediminis]|uniref:type II toxin-antitoxin system RelE/ParE family toxin n=1 Tax=Roseimarinus sediminis TaxID=1610899 RepID=UPI003D25361B